MKVLVAPNALKGSLRAEDAARAICEAIEEVDHSASVDCLPLADGGDGFASILGRNLQAEKVDMVSVDALRRPVKAAFYYLPETATAIIEMASAAGLRLLKPDERNILNASTEGVGVLIRRALDHGAQRILLGLGGSATCDGGAGMARALGVRFLDAAGGDVDPVPANIMTIASIDVTGLDERILKADFKVACDVDNPLLGALGAAHVFAPQKGADKNQVEWLEEGLGHLARIFASEFDNNPANKPGAGAAGGTAAGAVVLLGAEMVPGFRLVAEEMDIEEKLSDYDLVITAEGRLDAQSLRGKATAGLAGLCQQANVPCVVLAGDISGPATAYHQAGFTACFSFCPGPVSQQDAMSKAADYLARSALQVYRVYKVALEHKA